MAAAHHIRPRRLLAPLVLALGLAVAACTPDPAPSGYAQAPGVYFHNDVKVFTAVGAGTARH